MVGLIVGAAILGIIIAAMERGEFPGWGKMVFCVLAAVVPAAVVNAFLPGVLSFIGAAVGAVGAWFAIALTCGMSVKRAGIAAGLYFAAQSAISLAFSLLFR